MKIAIALTTLVAALVSGSVVGAKQPRGSLPGAPPDYHAVEEEQEDTTTKKAVRRVAPVQVIDDETRMVVGDLVPESMNKQQHKKDELLGEDKDEVLFPGNILSGDDEEEDKIELLKEGDKFWGRVLGAGNMPDGSMSFSMPNGDVIFVTECGMSFSKSGLKLMLKNDLECDGNDGITLTGDDITLFCDNFAIEYVGDLADAEGFDGIIVAGGAKGAIINLCKPEGWPEDGIIVIDDASATIANSDSTGNERHGLRVDGGSDVTVFFSTFNENSENGIFIASGTLSMESSSANKNGATNIFVEENGEVSFGDDVVACFANAAPDIDNQGTATIEEPFGDVTCDTADGFTCTFECVE